MKLHNVNYVKCILLEKERKITYIILTLFYYSIKIQSNNFYVAQL